MQLLADPSSLHFDPLLRRCDLRSGVSYNQGRCILYLLSLWIKNQSGARLEYEFLLPRSMLKPSGVDPTMEDIAMRGIDASTSSVSHLEHVMLHSYSAEYLLSQYFSANEMKVEVIEPTPFRPSAVDVAANLDSTPQVDAFGRPIRDQAAVRFVVEWP